jgi:hypothetical protein
MKRILTWLAALAMIAGLGLVAATSAQAAAPYCGITWGSLTKATGDLLSPAPLTNVRAGRHGCYDRLVMDIAGPLPRGFQVEYVDAVRSSGSGAVVPLRGGAFLQITLQNPAHDNNTGMPTYNPANRSQLVNVSGWRTFRQVALVSDFEGYTDLGLGVRARLPFRVFSLAGPGGGSRVVIDVAHRW